MRILQKYFVFLAFSSTIACSDPVDKLPEDYRYMDVQSDACISNPENKYHILLPEDMEKSQKLPLVLILDAHGDGKMAVNKFRGAVRYFPCILVGSDLVRNNFPGYEQAVSQLLSDVKTKYPIDGQHIIISGFSGGARMAYSYSLQHPVKGVLMCGAGPGQQKPSCPVYAISGMGDFNFGEQYVAPVIGSFSNEQFTADYFHGIHEWPQPGQLSDALLFLLRDFIATEEPRKLRTRELVELADSLGEAGNAIMAWKALEKSAKLSVNQRGRSQAENRGEALLQNNEFRKVLASLEKDLNQENGLRQAYASRLLTEDVDWWKREISVLNKKIEAEPPGLTADHYLRIKGYIGILLYSTVNHMVHADPDNPQLKVILDTYEFAEPANPDPYFYRAVYAWHYGDSKACVEYIKRSIELGFSEWGKLEKEFPGSILESLEE